MAFAQFGQRNIPENLEGWAEAERLFIVEEAKRITEELERQKIMPLETRKQESIRHNEMFGEDLKGVEELLNELPEERAISLKLLLMEDLTFVLRIYRLLLELKI